MNADSTRKITILQVLPALESGGVERGTLEIANAAVKEGFISLVASSGGRLEAQLKAKNSQHIYLPLNSKNPITIWQNNRQLQAIIVANNVDIVHARSRAPAWSAYFAAKATGAHFITTFHGTYGHKNFFKRLYNSVMTKGERVIAVSNFISQHMQKNYNIDAQKIEVIHRGVDMDYFDPAKISQERMDILRKKWGLENDWPVVIMPARITRWKGHMLLISALSQLDKNMSFYCVMVGNSAGHEQYFAEINEAVTRSNLSGKVRLVATCDDMPAAYALANIVVSASTNPEAFGRVAVEAQAMGKPIIATDIGGSKETIIAGTTGRLVNPIFAKEMTKGIAKGLMLDDSYKQEILRVNRQHIAQNFSLQLMCNKTIALYKKVCG